MSSFEEIRSDLMKKYNVGTQQEVKTGNEEFDRIRAELMAKYSGGTQQKETVGSTVSQQVPEQPESLARKYARMQHSLQLYDSIGSPGIPREALIGAVAAKPAVESALIGGAALSGRATRMVQTSQAEAKAKQAQQAYDDYVAGQEYQQYLAEQQTPYIAGQGAAMTQGASYAPGIEAKKKTTADSRAERAEGLKAVADYYENQARMARDNQTLGDDMEEFRSWPEEDRAALVTYVINSNRENYDPTRPPELGGALYQAGGLVNKYGLGKVRQMAESYSRWENARNSEAIRKSAEEAAKNRLGWSSVGSVAANALANYTGIGGFAGEMAGRTGRYSTLDPNNIGTMPGAWAGTVRQTVAKNIEGENGGALRKAGALGYQATMSAADNLLRMVMGGEPFGVKGGSLALAVTGSFGQTMADASRQGANPGEAAGLALASSFFEVLTEKVSIDNLMAQAAGGKQSLKQIIKNALKAGGVEMTEEGLSFGLNQIADNAILQGDSGLNRRIGELMVEEGVSYREAKETAAAEIMLEAGETLIVSGLSGGMMSGGTSAITNTAESISERQRAKWEKELQRSRGESMILEEGEAEGLSLATPGVRVETTDRVKQKFIEQAGRLAKATGKDIVFVSDEDAGRNGWYKDHTIYVNTRSGNALGQIVSHELTHSTEFADAYKDLAKAVFDRIEKLGADLKTMRKQKMDLYAKHGVTLTSQKEVDQEIVAEFVEQYLLTDAETILDVVSGNRTLGERIRGWLNGLLAKLGSTKAEERVFLENARNLWSKALEQSRGVSAEHEQTRKPLLPRRKMPAMETAVEDDFDDVEFAPWNPEESEPEEYGAAATDVGRHAEAGWSREPVQPQDDGRDETLEWARQMFDAGEWTEEEYDAFLDEYALPEEELGAQFSFAGERAKTADLNALNTARDMEKHGVSNETIRQQTGWFKGMDGKWRFEVDDSGMRYSRRGDLGFRERNPGYVRYRELLDKSNRYALELSDDAPTDLERSELKRLGEIWGGTFRKPGRVTVDALPQSRLADYIQHDELFDAYPQLKEATIMFTQLPNGTRGQYDPERNIIRISEELRRAPEATLIHEIQHAIQEVEGFTGGASVEYWKQQRADIVETIAGARRNLDMWLNDIGYKETQRESLLAASRREKTMEQHWKDMAEFKANSKYARQIAACEAELAEFQRQYDEITHGMTAYEQYENTAGEIEARDVAARRNLTAEERKKTPPNLGSEDTVFADGSAVSAEYVGKTKDGIEVYETSEQVKNLSWQERKKQFMHLMRNQYRGRTAKFVRNGHTYYAKFGYRDVSKNIYGDGHSDQKGRDAKINTGADGGIFELVENSTYSGSESERGKVQRMHRGVKYWDYFVKTVQIDGTVFDLIAKVRKKDDGEYVYEIEMNENEQIEASSPEDSQKSGRNGVPNASNNNIQNDQASVKQFSISEKDDMLQGDRTEEDYGRDSEGRSLSWEQQDYFKDSVVRDRDGNLLVMYHGTSKGGHNTFDAWGKGRYGLFGYGNYFTDNRDVAEGYTKKGRGTSPQIYEVYLNVTNPMDMDGPADVAQWQAAFPEADFPGSGSNEDCFRAAEEYMADMGYPSWEMGEAMMDSLEEMGYDGITHIGGGRFNGQDDTRHRVYITFESNQAKNVDNQNPTPKRDIRYSISEEAALNPEQAESQSEAKTAEQIRAEMPAKARSHLMGTERKLLKTLGDVLTVSKFHNQEELQKIVREVADTVLTEGRVSDEQMDFLFDRGYAGGIVADATMYDQYKDVASRMRTSPVTLSRQDQSNIADFKEFRKRASGTLKIVNQGGLPVDSAYRELQEMAPELFPDSITHPADQLMRMYEVGSSIRVSEVSLRHHWGPMADTYRGWARNDFGEKIGEVIRDLRDVKEVAEEAARNRAQKSEVPTTVEEAKEVYKNLKKARRDYEKVRAKTLLTERAEQQVGRLLRGEILLEDLNPETDNVRAITAVYEAKQEYERINKLIAQYKKNVRAQRQERADSFLQNAINWKDKRAGIAYSRETMERNIYDIVPDRAEAEAVIREYFSPVHDAEAEATRFKNQLRDKIRNLNLSRKVKKGNLVSEAHAVQLLGEAEDNIRVMKASRGRLKQRDGKTLQEWQAVIDALWDENPGLDQGKIRKAVAEFRGIYDTLFEQMNEVRVRNGYEPVNYRQGYFPHFQPGDGDGVLAHFGKVLGIDTQVAALPTSINGLTHTFKPGIQWFGNAQERLGFNTAYDAVEGFDKYLEGVASVIFQTDNIQNLRALESRIRYQTTDDGIRQQVDAVNSDDRLTEEEKKLKINDILEHGRYTLSNFVTEVSEYTNLLANKKSRLDRTMEAMMGRRAYTIMKAWESRVGANMIAGNISSALTNFIPLTQAGAQLGSGSMLQGMWQTLKGYKADDGIPGMSTFLTNRRGSDPLVKTWTQKVSDKIGMSFLMDLVDGFTSESILRAAYIKNLKAGLSEGEALHQADMFASSVMADRSKGAMPTLFESSNPIFKMFTQFQLEVNNQYSEIFKDLPRRFREKGVLALTAVYFKYFLGAFLFNELYEFFAGRRPALDPIGILNDTVGDLTGYELPNMVEWITGGDVSFQTEKKGLAEAGTNLAKTALGELPFSSGLTMLGIETDGGRIPASSAVPDLTALWQAATEEDWSKEKRWKEVSDELWKLAYIIPPFGGNQAQKLWKGTKAWIEGGSYSVDKEGNDILQYPVYKQTTEEKFWNLVRAAFLGKSSLPEAQDWVESGFDSLGAKQTAVYQDLVEAGVGDRDAFSLLQELQVAEKTDDASRPTVQRELLAGSGISPEGKAIVYYGLMASDSDRELMDQMADGGSDMGTVADVLMQIKNINSDDTMKGAAGSCAKRDAIAGAALTDEEKIQIYTKYISDSRADDISQFAAAGLSFDEFLTAQNEYARINEQYSKASEKALAYAHWVNGQDYSDAQKAVVREVFSYYSMFPASASKYDKLIDGGMDADDAYELTSGMAELEPEAGADEVSDLQKWRLCIDSFGNEAGQLSALRGYMTESQFSKVQTAHNMGVKPDTYIDMRELLPKYDADGNGSLTQKETKAAIDTMKISNDQKAVLWQLATGAKSAKNNPYSQEIGQEVLDAMA